MSLKQEILNNNEYFQLAKEISEAYIEAHKGKIKREAESTNQTS